MTEKYKRLFIYRLMKADDHLPVMGQEWEITTCLFRISRNMAISAC